MTDESLNLLPCAHCGGAAERIDFGPGDAENEGGSCIACTKCGTSGPVEFGYKENFISNWNRRTPGWRPISEAPRDGSVFLTFIPDMEGEDAFDFAYWSDEWGDFVKVKCGFQYVTHWRPLPPPPGEG